MSESLEFTVLGPAQPQGSIRAFMVGGKPRLTSTNAKVKPWRNDVGWAAIAARAREGWPEGDQQRDAVHVSANFYFAKPKSAKKRADVTVKPDVDKLARALLDAMTGILFADDSQVVSLHVRKFYDTPERTEVAVLRKASL
jgi:Holliday junction resolvase RusA-like endonuclease